MFRISLIAICLIAFSITLKGQNKPVSFTELEILQSKESKPVVVLIMTSWCKYCHGMKNSMLNNLKVSSLLAEKFRIVFLDAESKNDIFFAGSTFKYKSGFHELARELGTIKGQVSYPTLCILNNKNEIIYQHDGYLSPRALAYIFRKVGEG